MAGVNGKGLAVSGQIVAQGERAVGNATVPLSATSVPCHCVWVGAPSTSHTKGGPNTGSILIGKESGGNASGGQVLENDNFLGFVIPICDASLLYLTGFNANDVVEWQAWGSP